MSMQDQVTMVIGQLEHGSAIITGAGKEGAGEEGGGGPGGGCFVDVVRYAT